MSNCDHDLAECYMACADGYCPLCLAAENEKLREAIKEAPHDTYCAQGLPHGECTCWKRKALEEQPG